MDIISQFKGDPATIILIILILVAVLGTGAIVVLAIIGIIVYSILKYKGKI